jgi:hypothetical protein
MLATVLDPTALEVVMEDVDGRKASDVGKLAVAIVGPGHELLPVL